MAHETLPGMAAPPVWARRRPADDDGAPGALPIPGDVPLLGAVAPGEYQTWAPRGADTRGD